MWHYYADISVRVSDVTKLTISRLIYPIKTIAYIYIHFSTVSIALYTTAREVDFV